MIRMTRLNNIMSLNIASVNQKDLRNRNSKLRAYMQDHRSGYSQKKIDDFYIILLYNKIYVPLTICIRVLDW